jgi:hypothetical protein
MFLRVGVLFLVATGFVAKESAASPMTLVTDTRIIRVKDPNCYNPPICSPEAYFSTSPAPAFSAFNSSMSLAAGTVNQNTIVSQSAMSGSLDSASSASTPGFGPNAESVFEVTFDADVAAPYVLTGTGVGSVIASLFDVTASAYVFSTTSAGALSRSGTLVVGHRYRLNLTARTFNGGPSSSWTFNYSASAPAPVPLDPRPAAMALLVGLILGLWRLARSSS